MNKKNIDIYSYIKTIILSMFCACIFTGAIIYYAQNDVINNISSGYSERVLNEYIKNTVISQNELLEAERPNDYRIDIHLGYLYKVVKDFDKAEYFYKKAVEKQPLGIYKASYELASFYIERERLDEAKYILESLPQKSNSTLIKYQSYLHRKLGDAYYKQELFYYALEDYEDALYYWKKLYTPQKAYTQEINKKIYNSAINIADICINHDRVKDAIGFLRRAERVKSNDFNLKYKLALALANYEPEQSCEYFKQIYKHNPSKVNYNAYYQVLDNLSAKYYDEGDYPKSKLYRFRAEKLLEDVSENILYPSNIDFKITNSSLYKLNGKYKILINYTLQNISNIPIKRLSMDVVYKLNDKVLEEYTKTLIESEALGVGDSITDGIVPKLFRKYKPSDIQNISVTVYLYKNPDKRICVFNDKLFVTKQFNVEQPKYNIDCDSYIKFFAEQILNIKDSLKLFKNNL
ncbi:MAG: tetratricopeptide repeat protein [Candidatus Gastranaerophilaceae bacterium]